MVTICGYLDNLQVTTSKYVPFKTVMLKDQEKKDFTKIYVQVPKRRPQIKNFHEDDPRMQKIQTVLI